MLVDKIFLNGLQFYGYHGVFPEETKLGQIFIVDVALYTNLKEACKTDCLEATINYGEVYEGIASIVEGKPLKLIEALAERIWEQIYNNYPQVKKCAIKVTKPNPPIRGHYQSVAVEIERER